MDAFRTFGICPPPVIRAVFQQIQNLTVPLRLLFLEQSREIRKLAVTHASNTTSGAGAIAIHQR